MSTSLIGQTIGHYRVLDQLGAGGMGVVYRAQDLTLGRQVALKVLTTDAASSEDALERFRREARTASSLNHPNICTIYGFDEQDGRGYLAMELLDGEALDQRLGDDGLPLADLLDIGIQMADALDAAHAEGVLHRDIKPANIFITKRGQVKVLDFGLAKLTAQVRTGAAGHDSRSGLYSTVVGTTVGTVAYMSPEQARGEPLDPRTDLFSFGVVLYEMATGRQGFPGHTTAVVFDGILNRDPSPPSSINPAMPPAIDRIVAKALEKDRELRYQTAADIRADLQRLRRDTTSQRVAVAPPGGDVSAAARPPSAGYVSAPTSGAASTLFRAEADSTPALPSATGHGEPDSYTGNLASRAAGRLQVPWMLAGAILMALLIVGATLVLRPADAPASSAGVDAIPVTEQPPDVDTAVLPSPSDTPPAQPPPAPVSNTPSGPATAAASAETPAPTATREAEAAQRLDIARAKLANSLLDQGVADLRQIALDYPNMATAADALLLAAESLESAGRADDAMAVYVEFENRFHTHARMADSRLHRALLLRQSRQQERQMEGYTLLGEVAHAYPGTPQAHEALQARRQIEQQRRQLRAEDPVLHTEVPALLVTLRMLADQFPDDPQSMVALNQLATGYQDLNQYEAAADTWERMARQFPGNPMEVWFRLGEFYERRLRDTAKARAAYGNVPPESPRYREAQQRLKRL